MKSYFNKLKIFFYSGYNLVDDKSFDLFKKTILFGIDTPSSLKFLFKKDNLIMGDLFIDSKNEKIYLVNLIYKNIRYTKTKSFEGLNLIIIDLAKKIDDTITLFFNDAELITMLDELNYLGNIMLYTSVLNFLENKKEIENKSIIHGKIYKIYESMIKKKSIISIHTVNNHQDKELCSYKITSIEKLFVKDFYALSLLVDKYGYSLLVVVNSDLEKKKELAILTDSLLVRDNNIFIGITSYGMPAFYQEHKEITDMSQIDYNGTLHHYLDSFFDKNKSLNRKNKYSYKDYFLMYIS